MTNPTDLLPRFAAAAQWLAEHHPDSPRLPECYDLENECVLGHIDEVWSKKKELCHAPDACLAGAMGWAMEVANYGSRIQKGLGDTHNEDHAGWSWYFVWDANDIDLSGFTPSKEEAWLRVLESICTALGRGGRYE